MSICGELSGYGTIPFDIAFDRNFFAIVDGTLLHVPHDKDNHEELTHLGESILKKINATMKVSHPYLAITTVDLVEFSFVPDIPGAERKNIVIFGDGQIDRSPCGTGTSAKVADLYMRGELSLGQPFVHESVIDERDPFRDGFIVGQNQCAVPRA